MDTYFTLPWNRRPLQDALLYPIIALPWFLCVLEPCCLDLARGASQKNKTRAPRDLDAVEVSSQKTGVCDCLPSPWRTGRVLGKSAGEQLEAARPIGHLSAHWQQTRRCLAKISNFLKAWGPLRLWIDCYFAASGGGDPSHALQGRTGRLVGEPAVE